MSSFAKDTKRVCVELVGLGILLISPSLFAQADNGGAFPQQQGASQANGTGINPQTGQPNPPGITSSQPGTPNSMRDSLGAPGMTGQEMLDKQFIRTAAEAGIADVKMGTLATEKGSPAVKTLAQRMIDDHTLINKDIDSVADSMGVMLPRKMSKDQQREYEKLSTLSGKDFDTEYVTYLLKAHFSDLHAFHMEASVAANPQLAAEVVKDMGMMHQHIGLIVNVAKDEGIQLPPRPPRPSAHNTSTN